MSRLIYNPFADPLPSPFLPCQESIDEELDRLDILLVFTDDDDCLARVKPDTIPSVGLFRNGNADMIMFDGHIENEMGLLKFLTDLERRRRRRGRRNIRRSGAIF